jgi:hypothetical protein
MKELLDIINANGEGFTLSDRAKAAAIITGIIIISIICNL